MKKLTDIDFAALSDQDRETALLLLKALIAVMLERRRRAALPDPARFSVN